MNKLLSWSIRTYLIIFISLLALPSLGLIIYSGLAARKAAIDDANKECLEVVNSLAGEQQAVVAGAEQLAATLALLPEVQSRNSIASNALLRDLLKRNPRYANIVIGDASGSVWASAVPFQGQLSMADRKYFQEAVRSGMFSSGEYGVGRAAGRPMMSFGYPIKNAADRLIGVIAVALDLDYAQRSFEKISLPPGSSFGLLDHQGIILIRNRHDPFSERLIGKRDPKQENFTPMTGGAPEGTFEAMGNDGILRLAAYRKLSLPHEATPYMYVRSSIPRSSATSAATAAMLKNLTAVGVLYLIGLLLVWLIAKRVVVNPIRRLVKASEQLAAGERSVHVSRVVEGGDLGRLARSFDEMADALLQKEKARDVAEASLRESEERYRTTVTSIGDAVIATDTAGSITFMNAEAEKLTGWALDEARGEPVAKIFAIINEMTRKEVESPVTRVLREGIVVGLANHTILVKKDGTEVPIDDSGAPIRGADGKPMGVVLVFRDITERKQAMERTSHLASFPELNPNPVIEVDAAGSITFCNPGTLGLLEDLGINRQDCECFLPQDLKSILDNWDKKTASTLYREVLISNKLFGETIQLIPQFGVARLYALDVTERKRAEEALRQSDERFRLALRNAPVSVAVQDRNLRYVWAYNQRTARPEEIIGKRDEDIFTPDEAARITAIKKRVLEEGSEYREQMWLNRPSGPIFLDVYWEPVYDGTGRVSGIGSATVDMTPIKLVEDALRKARDELEQRVEERTADVEKERRRLYDVLETLPAMICLLTPDHHVAFANRSFRERFGESMGRYCYEFCFGKTDPCEFCESYEVLKSGKPHHWEVTTPDGSAIIDAWDFPFTDVDGSPLILEMDIDITDRKRAEAELKSVNAELRQTYEKLKQETAEREQAEHQLRQAQKMEALGTLSGGIAHDFNNILAAIIGFTELVAEHAPVGSRDEHHLHRVMEASLRGRQLVKQMLTFSRSTAEEKKPLLLSSIVKETARLLRATTPTTISIRVTIVSESGLILGDPTQIQQILMNLCTNATYAMREKGGILDIELADFSVARTNGNNHGMEPGLYMKLVVRDTGTGVSPDIIDKIFDPFFTTKKLGEGTGLGLSVVHGIVKRSGGYITVESTLDKGSTFTVYFPKVVGEEKTAAPSVDVIPTGSERVLFVDDEEAIVELSEDILAELGYEVTSRTSSKAALALVKENPSRFDLVITDQTMPEMTGVELAKEILVVRPDMPIIMCTGFSHLVDADRANAAGIKAFAMKPLTKREIARTIRKVLDE